MNARAVHTDKPRAAYLSRARFELVESQSRVVRSTCSAWRDARCHHDPGHRYSCVGPSSGRFGKQKCRVRPLALAGVVTFERPDEISAFVRMTGLLSYSVMHTHRSNIAVLLHNLELDTKTVKRLHSDRLTESTILTAERKHD